MKKKSILLMITLVCSILSCACNKNWKSMKHEYAERTDRQKEIPSGHPFMPFGIKKETPSGNKDAKGYNLPIDARQRAEAEEDCKEMMGLIFEIYENAEKGCASDVVIADEVIDQMVEQLKATGCPVTITEIYSNMENYTKLEDFLNAAAAGSGGSAVVYEIHSDGGIGRYQYSYDGKDMYVLSAKAAWSDDDKPVITYISYTRIKEWRFTDKGYFCYELCVPEYPEVTEIVDGCCMVRVKPITEENREMSERCVLGLAYQGNNLLYSDWDLSLIHI